MRISGDRICKSNKKMHTFPQIPTLEFVLELEKRHFRGFRV